MKSFLTIASREISRLARNFRGGASPLAVILLLAVLVLSVLALRQTAVLGYGLYRLGVSPGTQLVQDARFTVVTVDRQAGEQLLRQGAIDAYIDGPEVLSSQAEKSRYALGALKRSLAQQELQRIGSAYPPEQAFPLRLGIHYLDPVAAPLPTEPEETVIPSLMKPTAPFARVIVAMFYILPVIFISIFFTSSFMDEKINRRLTVLMSTPVSPFQIILGKMLPYFTIALVATAVIAVLTRADVWLSLAIFTPAIAFLFAIYLMVPLFYRTFKDITFISMLVSTLTTTYLVFPAMFTGLSDLAYMSPLTLAVKMYNHEPFGWREYLFPSLPMLAIFALALYAGARLLNEEFVMGYRPILRKAAEAIYLLLEREHPYLSIALLSLMVIPITYMLQLVVLVVASNLPVNLMLVGALFVVVLVEEIVKSMGILVLFRSGVVRSARQVIGLAFCSALGFLVGEKLLLFVSVSAATQGAMSGALFSTGFLVLVPLLAHFVFTAIASLLSTSARLRYPLALLLVSLLHALYNWMLVGGLR